MNNEKKKPSIINFILLLNELIKQFESQLQLTVIFMTTINKFTVPPIKVNVSSVSHNSNC